MLHSVTDFIFSGSKITADGDCSHEIKRRLLLGRKAVTNLDSILKSRDITLPTKVCPDTGVGCHFLLRCIKVKSESEVAQSCPTLRDPHGLYGRLLCPWDSPDKNTRVRCHFLLQGIFPAQESNLCPASPALAGRFFSHGAIWEAPMVEYYPSIKRNEFELVELWWMNLELVNTECSKKEKQIY